MMDAVHRYDGYVVQSTGDGIFPLFGAPLVHETIPQDLQEFDPDISYLPTAWRTVFRIWMKSRAEGTSPSNATCESISISSLVIL